MKLIFLLVFLVTSLSTYATDFSGTWSGTCKSNDETFPVEIQIQNDLNTISYDGDQYSLTAPTITKVSGKEEGQAYQIVMVYDWQWNADKTKIITNERWLGWFVSQPGSWSAKAHGYIKMDGAKLVTKRSFSLDRTGSEATKEEEECSYSRK